MSYIIKLDCQCDPCVATPGEDHITFWRRRDNAFVDRISATHFESPNEAQKEFPKKGKFLAVQGSLVWPAEARILEIED